MPQKTRTASPRTPDPFVAGDAHQASVSPEDLVATLAVGRQLLVGAYRVDEETGTLWGSDEVLMMHGYEPGEVSPSLELLRKHQHPDERSRVVREVVRAMHAGRLFACSYRIVDARGRNRCLLITGRTQRHPDTGTLQVVGYFVDITAVRKDAVDQHVKPALEAAYISAAAVERAKGVLMAVHGVGEDAAAGLLAQHARQTGAGVQQTAEQVVAGLAAGTGFGAGAAEQVDAAVAAVRWKRPSRTRRPSRASS